jgi:LysM repeat protein
MRGIARRYGLSAAELARRNDLNETARIRPGDRLRIAAASPLD